MLMLCTINNSAALTFFCSYYTESRELWSGLKNVRSCDAEISFKDGDPVNLQSIELRKGIGESSKIQYLRVLNQESVTRIPRMMYIHLPHLQAIHFYNTGLNQITSEDFYGLIHLKSIDFNPNKIVTIGNNVFKHLPNIVAISFWGNPIKYIGFGAFSGMKYLRTVHFVNTPCSKEFVNHGSNEEALQIVNAASENCPPSINMMYEFINGFFKPEWIPLSGDKTLPDNCHVGGHENDLGYRGVAYIARRKFDTEITIGKYSDDISFRKIYGMIIS